jgi:tetratricopeptide (TPR) repeat protein
MIRSVNEGALWRRMVLGGCLIVSAAASGCNPAKTKPDPGTTSNAERVEPREEDSDSTQIVNSSSGEDSTPDEASAASQDPPSNQAADPATGASADREPQDRSAQDRESQLARAEELAERGQYAEAATLLKRVLVANPQDAEVLFLLANLSAAQGDLAEAITVLDGISPDHPEAGIPSLGQSADWCLELKRYDEAERRYREVLRRVPEAAPARRQLAFLLNRQGRRHEAAEQIRELCMLGDVRQDELHSLIMLSHAMYDEPQGDSVDPQQVTYEPVGEGGVARKQFTDAKFKEAADTLQPLIDAGNAPPAIDALYGRAVVESQDDQRFVKWLAQVNPATKDTADYWAALGTYLISQRRFEEATRALLEAADRDPTDMNSFGRLGQTLRTLGDTEASQRWLDRWEDMNELIKANNRISESNPPNPQQIDELIALLEKLNRPLEAVLWKSIADHYRGASQQELAANQTRLKVILQGGSSFASDQQRLCNVDKSLYPIPRLDQVEEIATQPIDAPALRREQPTPASFQDVAEAAGVDHAYQVAAQPQTEGFAIYQTYGGAVACLDFDLDGHSDLYFAQGGSDPPSFQGPLSDQLYRNLSADGESSAEVESVRMVDVTNVGNAVDNRYSLGATAGDWNQDGFADLVIANLGEDTLLINRGDGTFDHVPIVAPNDQNRVPSSVAMADLSGDSLPDMYELSYVDDPTMIYLPKRDESRQVIKAMSPMQYAPGPDRICINDGQGGMVIRPFNTDATDFRAGLGLIVTDFNGQPGNEVFVGNDLYPDQLWVRDPATDRWSDVAPAVGCAFGIRGSMTASMGIGAGDVDNNGLIDIHVTNYFNRNSSLFLNLGESFLERNVQYGLAEASMSVLGFGTQMIDYDNDGLLDMAVTNGHIEKAITIDEPFEQPAQLFSNLGGRFQLIDVDDPSGYWGRKHLGRGLARVDLNRDGKNDIVITHLGERSALLVNRTPSDHHWLQVQLVGVNSERDAIGATVTVDHGEADHTGRQTSWTTAGDGYLSRNEPVVHFGLGREAGPVRVQVKWPDGSSQTWEGITPDRRVLMIQGEDESFALP